MKEQPTSKDDNELIQRVCRGVASIQEGERLRAYIAGLQSALERSQHQITMLLGARAPVETFARRPGDCKHEHADIRCSDCGIDFRRVSHSDSFAPLLAAANEVLANFMPSFGGSREVDDCLVQLAVAVADAEKARPSEKATAPTWEDLRGIAPDATGTLSSEEFVRETRNAWDQK